MVTRITELSTDRPIVEKDGTLTLQSRTYFRQITERAVIVGSGSPDGVVEATQGATYIDEDASLGSVFYVKQKQNVGGDNSLGWALIG